jgi:hypothetical protein
MAFNYFDNSSALGVYQRSNTSGITSVDSNRIHTVVIPVGGVIFTTTGSHSWTAPDGVTSVCVVCIGGGGGGMYYNSTGSANTYAMNGGAGGALAWLNDYPVVPGDSYSIVVGAGGSGGAYSAGSTSGGGSYAFATSICRAYGGAPGRYNVNGSSAIFNVSSAYGTSGGGGGGPNITQASTTYGPAGGGGAGGYSGGEASGGTGRDDVAASGGDGASGGGAGGGASAVVDLLDHVSGGGGGTGVYGEGSSGIASTDGWGGGGSGGEGGGTDYHGSPGGPPVANELTSINGGDYGGGGGGQAHTVSLGAGAGAGGQGSVRIIWGPGRAFPSTNVSLEDSSDGETTV